MEVGGRDVQGVNVPVDPAAAEPGEEGARVVVAVRLGASAVEEELSARASLSAVEASTRQRLSRGTDTSRARNPVSVGRGAVTSRARKPVSVGRPHTCPKPPSCAAASL